MTPHHRFQLRRLHRVLGVIAAAGVFWLALTGLGLLYADDIELARIPVPAWLALGYGKAAEPVHLSAGNHQLEHDEYWRLDGKPVAVALHPPQRFQRGPGELYYAIADDGVAVFMADGTLVETLPATSFGSARLTRTGGDAQIICVGDANLHCTRDGAEWPVSTTGLPSVTPMTATAERPSLERLLLDLHAGRFLGPVKKTLWTAFGLAMLFLAGSGLHMAWTRHRRSHHPAPLAETLGHTRDSRCT